MKNLFGGMGNIMKQAQEFQGRMKKIQDELATKTVQASSGGGMVTVSANGKQEILDIQFDEELIKQNDLDMMKDLIVAATNEAIRKSQELVQGEMGKLTGGLNIPGLF